MQVHKPHCSQAHHLWSQSVATIRSEETTLIPSIQPIFFLRLFMSPLTVLSLRSTSISRSKIPSFFHMSTFAPVIILPPSFPSLVSFLFGMGWRIHEVITNIFTCSHPVCKNLSGGSASPNAQHSVRSTHEAAGSAHAFASSPAVEREVKWEICHPSQKAGLEWSIPWAFWVLYKRTGV